MHRIIFTAAIVSGLGISNPNFAALPIAKHAHDLLTQSIVLDTHVDTTQRLIWEHLDLANQDAKGSIDIPRMHQGGLNAVFFSIWMPATITGATAIKQALMQIDSVLEQVRNHPQDLMLCTTAAEINTAHQQGKIAILMGIEGGHMINNNLSMLSIYANLGVRYMTLTHTLNTDWADSSTDKPVHNGLTDFGKQVVREMNRVGMMVDISHVSDKTFYDALAVSKAPMIASHSSARAICSSERNMTDEMIKALAAKGGVIQINYFIDFLSQEFHDAAKNSAELKHLQIEIKKHCGENQPCIIQGNDKLVRQLVAEGKLPKVTWEKIIEHINHVVKLVGVDHVGLGSDFDGAIMPFGMEDATHLPQITQALIEQGYSDEDIQKILGGNILRVMKEVEGVAEKSR